MPISKTELIARGLALADQHARGAMPLSALVGNPNLGSLSPEERVDVLTRYNELSGSKTSFVPSMGAYLKEGVASGMMMAIPTAIGAGVLTAPSVAALKAAGKSPKAWLAVGRKVALPVGVALSLGAVGGALTGAYRRFQDVSANKYLERAYSALQNASSEDDKKIAAMALLSIAPYADKLKEETKRSASTTLKDSIEKKMITAERFGAILPPQRTPIATPELDKNKSPVINPVTGTVNFRRTEHPFPYNDWDYVHGLNDPRYGGVVNPEVRAWMDAYKAQRQAEKANDAINKNKKDGNS